MSDPVDRHLAKAFASLADVSARELEAMAEALGHRRRDPLGDFASIFREVAWSRENDSEPRIARFHVREYAERADEDLLGRIAEAEAPFWGHVRDAVLAYREEQD
jgi:hypothetical protein